MGIFRRMVGLEPTEKRSGETGAPVPPSRGTTSRIVTPGTALGLTGIYRSIQILATSVGQLELAQHRSNGTEMRPSLLVTRPDVDRTRRAHLTRTVVCLAGHGEAFWRIYRDPTGKPSVVRNLDPHHVFVGRDAFGRRFFDYRDPYRINAPVERLAPVSDHGATGDVLHLRLMEVPGFDHGLGPIQSCRLAVQGGLDLATYADNWFADSGIPNGVLSTTQALNSDDAGRYRTAFNDSVSGHGLAVLGSGLSYAPIMLKPSDAQFLESRQFSITDQARMMGIPAPYLLAAVEGSTLTYQNLEQVDQTLLKYTIMGYLNVIEDALSELLPIGQEARFKPWSFLRSDNKTRAEINKVYVDMGVKSRDLVAAEEGFPAPDPTPATTNADNAGQGVTGAGNTNEQEDANA